MKKERKKRATSPRPAKYSAPRNSEGLRRAWQNPEWRAALLAKRAWWKSPGRPVGVPDGMRRAQAAPLWEKAKQLSERFIKIMEDAGKLPKETIPGSKEDMGKLALAEAFRMGVGPLTDSKSKSAYLKIVLDFTMAKPESKAKLTLDKSEVWLAELEADMKNDTP